MKEKTKKTIVGIKREDMPKKQKLTKVGTVTKIDESKTITGEKIKT